MYCLSPSLLIFQKGHRRHRPSTGTVFMELALLARHDVDDVPRVVRVPDGLLAVLTGIDEVVHDALEDLQELLRMRRREDHGGSQTDGEGATATGLHAGLPQLAHLLQAAVLLRRVLHL